jgi:hypothetical protein
MLIHSTTETNGPARHATRPEPSNDSVYSPVQAREVDIHRNVELLYDEAAQENPAERSSERQNARDVTTDYYGAFSVETFAEAGGLANTHEDAQGWYDYVARFNAPNFWYRDAGVKPWAYYEEYDNWQDTYGMDAVNAVYHSGHGTMDGNGVFYAPLGAAWGNLGSWVRSDQMRLGNEQANYIFWSTCLSCRVHDGHSPIRTWSPANLGFRMLFGFETISWDDPNYGKFFWEEWNRPKSFSTAWMDASWRIAHDQAPAVVACCANQAEATDRLNNERLFNWSHVNTSWWQWRWYDAARGGRQALPARAPNLSMPRELTEARLSSPSLNRQRIAGLASDLGLPIRIPSSIAVSRLGTAKLSEGNAHLNLAADGSFRAQLRSPNLDNKTALSSARARSTADAFVKQLRLADGAEATFDLTRIAYEGGGTTQGSGRLEGPVTSETTIQYRQLIDGVPVIAPGSGELRVTIDNDGEIVAVESSLRGVERIVRSPAGAPEEPNAPSRFSGPSNTNGYEDKLSRALGKRLATLSAQGRTPGRFATVPGSTEVGYEIRGDRAKLIAQRAVEVDSGYGLLKRYWVRAALDE